VKHFKRNFWIEEERKRKSAIGIFTLSNELMPDMVFFSFILHLYIFCEVRREEEV
jgi:hypothetical protein